MTTVLVVDDSKFVADSVATQLEEKGYTVYTASTGEEGVAKAFVRKPDVVTMDVEMPGMGGIPAVRKIVDRTSIPVIMLSAHTRANAEPTIEALEEGAVDAIEKRAEDDLGRGLITRLYNRIEALDLHSSSVYEPPQVTSHQDLDFDQSDTSPLIVLGGSTGGPELIRNIVSVLPDALNARLLIVQHMPESFTGAFATRLDETSAYSIREGTGKEVLRPGEGIVAPGDGNLITTAVTETEVQVEVVDPDGVSPVPNLTTLLGSISQQHPPQPFISLILSGMGDDGADALHDVSTVGGHIIAQDEETSAVYGMPKKAVNSGYVDQIIPDTDMVQELVKLANSEYTTSTNASTTP